MTFTKEQKIIVILLVLTILGSISIVSYVREQNYRNNRHSLISEKDQGEESFFGPTEEVQRSENPTDFETNESIAIHIEGAVHKPGLYYLDEYSRYDDAVKKAGGFLADADRSKINLAKKIYDEAFIYVPMIGEDWDAGETPGIDNAPNKAEMDSSTTLVNINTANQQELMKLSGIGEVYAQRIIDYRTTNGNFQSIEDIMKVSGVGTVTFENIKEQITK